MLSHCSKSFFILYFIYELNFKRVRMVGTFKIITLAASLEEKIVDLENDYFNDSGSIKVSDATLHCWKHGGHGQQTYLEVVENSCNLGVNTGTHLNSQKPLRIV